VKPLPRTYAEMFLFFFEFMRDGEKNSVADLEESLKVFAIAHVEQQR